MSLAERQDAANNKQTARACRINEWMRVTADRRRYPQKIDKRNHVAPIIWVWNGGVHAPPEPYREAQSQLSATSNSLEMSRLPHAMSAQVVA